MGLIFLRRAAAFHRRAAPLCRRAVLRRASTKPVAIAYDLETTSAWPATAEVVQLAFTNVANSDEHFQALVLPEGGVDGGTGSAPSRRPPVVLAAHNGDRFDHPILRRLVAKHAAEADLASALWFDTLPLAREAFPDRRGPGSHTLGRLFSDATGGPLGGAHDALADARAVAEVWPWLVERRGEAWDDHLAARGASAAAAKRKRRAPAKAAAAGPPPEDIESLPGVGPYLAKQLRAREIADRVALEQFYRVECASSSDEVYARLAAMLPRVNKFALRKVARGLAVTPPLDVPGNGTAVASC
ncbi:exonuclease [Aureococcus anophagefferens]|nr:exonuclease [Aureococcus anophagefferens]